MKSIVVGFGIALLSMWGMACSELKEDVSLAGGTLTVHGSGWSDPNSINFHGVAIRALDWDMSLCRTCHGNRYEGGVSDVSCLECHSHPTGPEYCTTCHGSSGSAGPPRDVDHHVDPSFRGVGAHQKHLQGGNLSVMMPCSGCHEVPSGVYVPGHVDSHLPAEVPLNSPIAHTVTNEPATADYDAGLILYSPLPVYDSLTLKCGNTYCHGNFKNGNPSFSPVWTDASGSQSACGTCHGDVTKSTLAARALPKTPSEGGTHPDSLACAGCHADVVNSSLSIVNKAKHVNGKLDILGEERDF